MFIPEDNRVTRLNGQALTLISAGRLMEGDIFKVDPNGAWFRVTADPVQGVDQMTMTEGFLVEAVRQEFLTEGS